MTNIGKMEIENGLFIFRRDFRINDNTTLIEASKKCKTLHLCFIFTPEQVTDSNKYKSENSIQFMIESLTSLDNSIQGAFNIFYGENNNVLKSIIKHNSIDAVFFNVDYSPYAKTRDESINALCTENVIDCYSNHDYYLYQPGSITTTTGGFYKKYTPFMNTVINKKVAIINKQIVKNVSNAFLKISKKYSYSLKQSEELYTPNINILVKGGREEGVKRLKLSLLQQCNYTVKRDTLNYNTTFLSSYIKFGCVSIREVYHGVKNKFSIKHGIIRELIWRDFFAHILYNYPSVVGQSYIEKYRKIVWSNSISNYEKWKNGRTGFPVVDAGMRQLNETGYMHNRCRMVCATFLVKILLLDWRLGEQYFATKLTDYDIASNNGNWQGISSTGVDMKPYFRTMNPWIQSKKFDPECEYIKKWVPELKDVEPKYIHSWNESWKNHNKVYIIPIVEYKTQTEKMMNLYSNA